MPLSRLAVVSNFHSNSLPPFLLIIRILSSEAILLQILLYTLFPRFPWATLHLFPSNFSSVTLCIWELMSPRMTLSYHRRWLSVIISSIFTAMPTLSRRTSVDTLSTSLTPHILIIQCYTPHATSPHLKQ